MDTHKLLGTTNQHVVNPIKKGITLNLPTLPSTGLFNPNWDPTKSMWSYIAKRQSKAVK